MFARIKLDLGDVLSHFVAVSCAPGLEVCLGLGQGSGHGQPVVLKTPRLRLCDMRASDAASAFAHYEGDPEAMRYLGWDVHTDAGDTARQVALDVYLRLKVSALVWWGSLRVTHR
jgi:hypothetical protein